ncbi:hypothetical protein AQ930_11355 [Burkholderia pseudomallei]|nr:hypothetical protein AQ928_20195 [Burkholderia pseudomallei]OND22624.1 hypothetical protein AQ930_11355 [Burkholderia pseudomallei]
MKCDVRRPTYARRAREPDMRHATCRHATRNARHARHARRDDGERTQRPRMRSASVAPRLAPPAARRPPRAGAQPRGAGGARKKAPHRGASRTRRG